MAILGAGTGLGMARGIPDANGWIALASEGGHREFAPRTDDEWHLASWLKADLDLDRLSIERIVSGTGLGHVMRWRLQRSDGAGHPLLRAAEAWRTRAVDEDDYQDLPALVGQAAQQGDALARSALDLWLVPTAQRPEIWRSRSFVRGALDWRRHGRQTTQWPAISHIPGANATQRPLPPFD